MGFYTRSLKDYDGETTTFRVRSADLNAGNIATQITLQANLGAAINDMVLGALNKITYGNDVLTPVVASDDPSAQRELKWLVNYHDTITGKKLRAELGTADTARLDPNARGQAQIGDGAEVDAFVTAFEAYVLSDAGNAVEVDSIILVGRNN
jgi:hypothetical protein